MDNQTIVLFVACSYSLVATIEITNNTDDDLNITEKLRKGTNIQSGETPVKKGTIYVAKFRHVSYLRSFIEHLLYSKNCYVPIMLLSVLAS